MWAYELQLALDRVMVEMQPEAKAHVRNHAGFQHRSHRTLEGVRTKIFRTKSGIRMRITNAHQPVASYLEFGTKPHRIPSGGTAHLIFFWKKMGRWWINPPGGSYVNHPGTKPYKFMEASARSVHSRLHAHLQAAMQRLAKRF